MKIHGIPDSKVQTLLIKSHKGYTNKAKWAFDNLKAVINRVWYDLKCRVWITNKKLAEWSIAQYEMDGLQASELEALKKICKLALRHLPEHIKTQPSGPSSLDQRYRAAKNRHQADQSPHQTQITPEEEDTPEASTDSETELDGKEQGDEDASRDTGGQGSRKGTSPSTSLTWNRAKSSNVRQTQLEIGARQKEEPRNTAPEQNNVSHPRVDDHQLSGDRLKDEADQRLGSPWPGAFSGDEVEPTVNEEGLNRPLPVLDEVSIPTIDLSGSFEAVMSRLEQEMASDEFVNNPSPLTTLILDLPSHLPYTMNEEQRAKLAELKKKLFDRFPQQLVRNFVQNNPEYRHQLPETLQAPRRDSEDRPAEVKSEIDETAYNPSTVDSEDQTPSVESENHNEPQIDRSPSQNFLNLNTDALEAFLLEALAQPQENDELKNIIPRLPLEKIESLAQKNHLLRKKFLQFHAEYAEVCIKKIVQESQLNKRLVRRAQENRRSHLRLNFLNKVGLELDEVLMHVPSIETNQSYNDLVGLAKEIGGALQERFDARKERFDARNLITNAKQLIRRRQLQRLSSVQLNEWISRLKRVEELSIGHDGVQQLISIFEKHLNQRLAGEEELAQEEALIKPTPEEYVYKETDEFISNLKADYTGTVSKIFRYLYEALRQDLAFTFGDDLANLEGAKVIVRDPNLLLSIFEHAIKQFPAVFRNAQTPEEQALAASIIQSALIGQILPPASSPFVFGIAIPDSDHPLKIADVTFLQYLLGNDDTKDKFIYGFISLFVKDNINRTGIIRIGGKEFTSNDADPRKNWSAVFRLIRKRVVNLHPDKISEEIDKYNTPPFSFFDNDNPFLDAINLIDTHGDSEQTRLNQIIAATQLDEEDKKRIREGGEQEANRLVQLKFIEMMMLLNQKVGGQLIADAWGALTADDIIVLMKQDSGYYELDLVTLALKYKQDAFFMDQKTTEHLAETAMSLSIPSLFAPVRDVRENFTQGKLFVSFYKRSSMMELFTRITANTPAVMEFEADMDRFHAFVQSEPDDDYMENLQSELVTLQGWFERLNYENPIKLRSLKRDLDQALTYLDRIRTDLMEANEFVDLSASLKISEEVGEDMEKVEDLIDRANNVNEHVSRIVDLSEWEDINTENQEDSSEPALDQPISGLSNAELIRNLNEHTTPGRVNKIKAAKYDSLLTNLGESLKELDSIRFDVKDKPVREWLNRVRKASRLVKPEDDLNKYTIDYLTRVRDAFEITALESLREAIAYCEGNDVSEEIRELTYLTAFNLYYANDMTKASEDLLDMLTKYNVDQQPQPQSVQSLLQDQPGVLDRLGTFFKGFRRASRDSIAIERVVYTHPFVENLRLVTEKVSKAPAALTTSPLNRGARSVKDHFSLNFSPIGAGNPPQKMGILELERQGSNQVINIIGMGSPTLQPWMVAITKQQAVIDPLFKGYLYHLEKRKLSHLYVSLQNIANDEDLRNSAIMALQGERPGFYAITLAKNSHFYEGHSSENAQVFKKELYDQFFVLNPKKSGCYVSEKIKMQVARITGRSLEDTSRELIDRLHADVFDNVQNFDQATRRVFIELYYNLLVTHILNTLNIDAVNFTCKDGIDRGMGALASFEYLWMIMENKELDYSSRKRLAKTINLRAYWVRKRAIIKERSDRVYETMDWLLTRFQVEGNKEKLQQLVKDTIPQVQKIQLS